MKLEIEQALAQEINHESNELLASLQEEPTTPSDVSSGFRPNRLNSTVSLEDPEIPSGPLGFTIGITGTEVARFLPNVDPPVGLFDERHATFIDFCKKVQQIEPLQSYLSLTYVVEAVFEWIRLQRQRTTTHSLTEYFLARCRKDIGVQEVWLPVAGIDVEQEIDMGRVVVKRLTQEIWQRWVSELSVRRSTQLASMRRFIAELGTERVIVASQLVTAEPIRAIEIALDWTQSALEILSYFAPSNFEPKMPIICAVSGSEYVERPRHMILKEGVLFSAGHTLINLRAPHPWLITTNLLGKMKERGFATLIRLMNEEKENRSQFQHDILRAVSLFSRSAVAQNLNDKLLYAVLALEFILLKNQSESLQKHIGERMAYLIGQSWHARRAIIDNYKIAYGLRSGAVHHAQVVTDEETLKKFLPDAWHTLNRLIADADKFPTKQDMIAFVDNIKFS